MDNKSWQVTFNQLPKNIGDFKSIYDKHCKEAHQLAALTVVALGLWAENKEEAIKMINLLKGPEELSNYEIQFISERLEGRAYIVSSYFEGSTVENGYKPAEPYRINIRVLPHSYGEKGYVKFYLQSSGADSPRPIQLREKPSTGQWFLWDQMLLSEIRKPENEDPWA